GGGSCASTVDGEAGASSRAATAAASPYLRARRAARGHRVALPVMERLRRPQVAVETSGYHARFDASKPNFRADGASAATSALSASALRTAAPSASLSK